jgi:ribonuclease Z
MWYLQNEVFAPIRLGVYSPAVCPALAMKVEFIGVGEAFDETLPNNSQILEWKNCRLLIDCGYSIPQALWKKHPDSEYLNAIYISHRHADHYFGLPSVLVRLAEDKRESPLTVLCAEGTKSTILEMIDYAYQGILPKLEFQIDIQEVTTARPLEFRNAKLEFALSSHPVKNFAIAVSADGRKYAYSGDGNFNNFTRGLYSSTSLLVHEAYSWDREVAGHANIREVVRMAQEQNVERLALTHIQREVRRAKINEIQAFVQKCALSVIIPEPGDVLEV